VEVEVEVAAVVTGALGAMVEEVSKGVGNDGCECAAFSFMRFAGRSMLGRMREGDGIARRRLRVKRIYGDGLSTVN
jgi:hypothetical protein